MSRISMTQSFCVHITKRGRGRFHFNVTAASRRRLQKLVYRNSEIFKVRPFVTETVGWVAESN